MALKKRLNIKKGLTKERNEGKGALLQWVKLLSCLGQRMASSLELPTVLQGVVDVACELVGARYGAVGVFGASGRIQQFITHGVSPQEAERIGNIPQGLGILGRLNSAQTTCGEKP